MNQTKRIAEVIAVLSLFQGNLLAQALDQPNILGAQFPALYHHDTCHGSCGTA